MAKFHQKKDRVQKKKRPDGYFVVEGVNAVSEYLKFRPSCIQFIAYKSSSFQNQLLSLFPSCPLRQDQWLSSESRSVEESGLTSSSPVWASVKISTKSEDLLLADLSGDEGSKNILVLDHITDPRNLGAIMRTAAFYGIKHVVAPKDRQVLLTGASVGTSQGAFAVADLYVVTNLSRVLEELKKRRYWVLGTSLKGKPLEAVTEINSEDKLVFIMGSEEKGLSRGVEKACDWLVLLEGASDSLQSLNVSVAAGIFCDRLSQMRKDPKKKA